MLNFFKLLVLDKTFHGIDGLSVTMGLATCFVDFVVTEAF